MANVKEYLDPVKYFRECEADPDGPLTTGEGLTAALQKIDRGLYIGRHKKHGYYAILRRPWMTAGSWAVPIVDKRPVLVWELREQYGTRQAQELGDWVVQLVLAADLARQGYETPGEFAHVKYLETAEALGQAEKEQGKIRQEQFDEVFDVVEGTQRAQRTIRGWRPE